MHANQSAVDQGLFIDGKEHDNDPSSFKTAFCMSGRKYERLMNV